MLAILAAVCFFLALINVHIGSISLVILGFIFVALHLAFPVVWWSVPSGRRQVP